MPILLCLNTGARRNNVLSMRWDQLDFTMNTWRIPRTKNGDWQIVPLTESALKVLKERESALVSKEGEQFTEPMWVFPGKEPSKHLVEIKRPWQALLEAAKIKDLRIHDLRRTLGSYMAMSNQSLKMIGAALGHKSSSATEIYARIANDALRQALIEMIHNTRHQLEAQFTDTLPHRWLNAIRCCDDPEAIIYGNVPTSHVRLTLDQLEDLLREHTMAVPRRAAVPCPKCTESTGA